MPGPRSAGLNGLNWQVQVDPLTLSITSFAGAAAVVCEASPEAPTSVPAKANRATAAETMGHLNRFIDIVIPLSPISARSPARMRVIPLAEATYNGTRGGYNRHRCPRRRLCVIPVDL